MNQYPLLYKGKTKDVYKMPDHQVLLRFKDDVTGTDGVFDPGANTVGLSISGMGLSNLRMSVHFFKLLERSGIKTHFVSADLANGTMVALSAKPFGKGLEVICRRRAVGSFIRRYGAYIASGTALPDYVEMTLKDDERGDPLITKDGLIDLQILDAARYEELVRLSKRITALIAQELDRLQLELIDIKYEFGLAGEELVLMDEISAGNMRVWNKGASIEAMDLAARVVGEDKTDA
ncbi:MAG: phosphoribosylaminoimidazolesuccinocarboxamide synthase [Clostridiales bacterium]|nr:phosphoribosylaminoimidazolesuccinocarboxamide synthase [Clostridiales bacterium]